MTLRPIRLERVVFVLLMISTISLLITNACTLQAAEDWREYALTAKANFERCKALRAPFPRPGAMITSTD